MKQNENILSKVVWRIDQSVCGVLSWVSFALIILLYLIPTGMLLYLFGGYNDRQRDKLLGHLQRACRLQMRFVRKLHVRIENGVGETFQRQAIVICNHQSIWEILACISVIPKLSVLLKQAYTRNFLLGPLARVVGYHFATENGEELYKELAADIAKGYSILIFPEGTRTRNGELGKFKQGAFFLAEKFKLDILPISVHGAYDLQPKGRLFPEAGEIRLVVHSRIRPTDVQFGKHYRRRAHVIEQYYRALLDMKPTAVVLGGGMGGMIEGAILSKQGYRVTVLEKNAIVGGGLQTFTRRNVRFNTGMHNFGGFGEEWALSHLFVYLGIKKQLNVLAVDEAAQEIVYLDKEHCYALPKGRERFEEYLAEQFPQEREGLHQYLDAIWAIANSFDLYMLRRQEPHSEVADVANLTVDELQRRYLHDERLIRLLQYMSPLCGLPTKDTPVSVHSMLTRLYISGEYRFAGGAVQLAEALASVIRLSGGEVLPRTEVQTVQVGEQHVERVVATDGRVFEADRYVVSFAPKVLFELLDKDVVRPVSRRRAEQFVVDSSAFSVYIKLKKQRFRFINSTVFVPMEKEDSGLPPYILLTTPPETQQGEWAETVEILLPMHYADCAKWAARKTGERGEEYEQWKRTTAEKLLRYIYSYYPDLEEAIDVYWTASPLTIRDYYNNPEGAMFAQQGLYIPLRTRTDNLYLTGQSVLYHGLCGVPLTAILTAEAVTGKDILQDILDANKETEKE